MLTSTDVAATPRSIARTTAAYRGPADTHRIESDEGVESERSTRPLPRLSVLRLPATWRMLVAWAIAYGTLAAALEAMLASVAAGLPVRPWHALLRPVQAVLWLICVACAIAVAERWPIRALGQWRRAVWQVGIGLAIGPLWGALAYALSGVFMPWRSSSGVWGVIAIEAKGTLFAYGTAVVVAHVGLQAREQRERAVAISELQVRAAEARVQILRIGLQSEGVLAALDGIIERADSDPEAANEALVQLADVLGELVEAARTRSGT